MKKSDKATTEQTLETDLRTDERINKVKAEVKKDSEPKRTEVLLIRVTADERKHIVKKASKHTRGNMSEWIRYASIILEP